MTDPVQVYEGNGPVPITDQTRLFNLPMWKVKSVYQSTDTNGERVKLVSPDEQTLAYLEALKEYMEAGEVTNPTVNVNINGEKHGKKVIISIRFTKSVGGTDAVLFWQSA